MERAVEEIEPNHGSKTSPRIDRFTWSHNRISQRDKVANGGTCPEVPSTAQRDCSHNARQNLCTSARLDPPVSIIPQGLVCRIFRKWSR